MADRRQKNSPASVRRSLSLALSLSLWLGSLAGAQGAPQGQAPTAEKMAAVIHRYVLSQAPWEAKNVQVQVAPFAPTVAPTGAADFRILKPTKGITPGVHSFLLAAMVAGKEAARFWLKADIRVFDEVVVTSYPLAQREPVTAAAVRVERRDVSSLTSRPFSRIEEVLGQQTVRFVEVNEIMTQKTLERPTLVKRGSAVVLVYETGILRVETPGAAEEGGKAGDLIQVKNPSSGKLLRGVVLDGRTVRVN